MRRLRHGQAVMDEHKKRIAAPGVSPEEKGRNESQFALGDLELGAFADSQAGAQPKCRSRLSTSSLLRTSRASHRKVLKIEGTWRCWGTSGKSFDMGTLDKSGKGHPDFGPYGRGAGGCSGYKMTRAMSLPQTPKTFSFDIDQSVTLMQEQISTRDGRLAEKGGLYVKRRASSQTSADRPLQNVNVYQFSGPRRYKNTAWGTVPLSKGLGAIVANGQDASRSRCVPNPVLG